jgi:hypothetical protein
MEAKESAFGRTLFNLGMVVLMLVIFLGGITVFRPSGGSVAEGSAAQRMQGGPVEPPVTFSETRREEGSISGVDALEAELAALSIDISRLRLPPFHPDLFSFRIDIDLSAPIDIAYADPGTSMMVLTEPSP